MTSLVASQAGLFFPGSSTLFCSLLDLPGYGKAQGLPADWTLEDLVSDVRNCIAEGNPFPPVVIAPSSSVSHEGELETVRVVGLALASLITFIEPLSLFHLALSSLQALFFQTYLESHALGALILLSPLPPNPS